MVIEEQSPSADTIYRPFFRAGIAVVLTLGATWGVLLLVRTAFLKSFTAISVHEINAHGHAQIFGWVGLFVMGFAYQMFPRFKDTTLTHPRWAYCSLWLMLGGLAIRSVLEPLVSIWPRLAIPTVAASVAEIFAVAIFITVVAAIFRALGKTREVYEYYIMAALGWFFVHAVYETVYLTATLMASDHERLLWLIATWQAPLRELQIHGFAMLMIFGVSQRIFQHYYGLPAPNSGKSLLALIVLNVALLGNVGGFILMRLASHAWAALWYGSILAMAVTVGFLIVDWHIYGVAKNIDRSLKFLRAAYAWLIISMAMLVLLPVYQFGILSIFAPQSSAASIGFSHAYYGAIRHAVTVGFISMMIMGVSARVVPILGGIDSRKLSPLWLPLILLNMGCSLRVATQILTDFTPKAFSIMGVSGFLEIAAIALWAGHLLRLIARSKIRDRCMIQNEFCTICRRPDW